MRITRSPRRAVVDGFDLSTLEVGQTYGLPTDLALVTLAEGWAEPALDGVDPKLPSIQFDIARPRERRRRVYSDWRLRVELGLAADRRRK